MGFHSPLIRPAISWGSNVAFAGGSGPLGSHDLRVYDAHHHFQTPNPKESVKDAQVLQLVAPSVAGNESRGLMDGRLVLSN